MTLGDRALENLRDWVGEPGTGSVLADRYELRERLGEGGMGVVYAAEDRVTGKTVAVKVVRGGGDNAAARFEREVASLERVSHPAVVKCIDHGVHEGARYLVMERLEGCSLAERLRLRRLSVRETLALGQRLAEGLAEVHRAGIAHRDIKPSNVFLTGDVGGACLLDFGIARPREATTLTAAGALVGTPGYMAPERVRGDEPGERDPAGDVFSLGCVIYECLLGRPPFAAETTYALLARVLLEVAPLVREERPDAPLGLEALILQMLEMYPDARPPAKEVARACAELLAAVPPAPRERNEIVPGVAEGDVVGGKYRIEHKLGEGGMGVVLAARHVELGTHVAIKLLRSGDAEEGRFLREARATSRIESDHVARVLDVGRTSEREGSRPFIVMEKLRGVDLARRLAARGPLPIHVAVSHVLQACDAVAEAHALGIVHRDLKPSNLFIVVRRDGSELVKVLDFGISKLTRPLEGAGSSEALTATADSAVMGSVAYMSPEQLESSARADARSDIWSLGVVLFELLSGTRPFEGENAVAVAARIAGAPPRSLRELRPEVPAKLEAVVVRCLAKDPSARFGDVAELAGALAPLAEAGGAETATGRDRGAIEPVRRSPKRSRVVIRTIGTLALGSVVAFVASRPEERASPVAQVAQASAAPTGSSSAVTIPKPDGDRPAASASAPASASASASASAPSLPTPSLARPRPSVPLPARPPSPAASPIQSPAPPASSAPLRREVDLTDPALRGR